MSDNSNQPGSYAQPPQPPSSPWAPTPPPAPEYRHRRHSGVMTGVVLIAIGVVFLAGQLIPGVAWWNLWPLLVVLGGIVQMVTRDHHDSWTVYRLVEGLGTVLLGVVLLGNTLGIVSWSVWWTFVTLWPALLIALGISILGRGLNQMWLRGVATLLVWATLSYAVAVSFTGLGGFAPIQPWSGVSAGQPYSFSEPVGSATRGTLDFQGGAGDIRIHGGDALVSASGRAAFGAPQFTVQRAGDVANVSVALSAGKQDVAEGLASGEAEVALARSIPWDAVIDTGASQLDADFSDMKIDHLTVKSGVSDTTLKLGEVPADVSSTDVEIKSGLSAVTLLVPTDAAVRIDTHDGLASTNLGSGFTEQRGGVWETSDIAGASHVINISVESGISSISVRTY